MAPGNHTRYRALRSIGCDPLSAAFIAFLNWMRDVPPNLVRFGTVEIELPDSRPTCADTSAPKDPHLCWNVRCQLGGTCCRAHASFPHGDSISGPARHGKKTNAASAKEDQRG